MFVLGLFLKWFCFCLFEFSCVLVWLICNLESVKEIIGVLAAVGSKLGEFMVFWILLTCFAFFFLCVEICRGMWL